MCFFSSVLHQRTVGNVYMEKIWCKNPPNVSCVLNADSRWQHIAFYPGLPHIIKFQKETKHSPFYRKFKYKAILSS